jgi:hypothetical protein
MPDKDKPKGKQQPDEKAPPDTAEVAFDDIIDAILGADPKATRDNLRERKRGKS